MRAGAGGVGGEWASGSGQIFPFPRRAPFPFAGWWYLLSLESWAPGPVVGAGPPVSSVHWWLPSLSGCPSGPSTPLFSQPKIPLPVALWSPGPAEPSHWSLFHKKQFRRTITGPLLIPASATPGGLSRFWAGGQLGGLGQARGGPQGSQGEPRGGQGRPGKQSWGAHSIPHVRLFWRLDHSHLGPSPSMDERRLAAGMGSVGWWAGSPSPRQRRNRDGDDR